MIKALLTYQEKDKQRLSLIFGVEQGKAKRELDEANRTIENSKTRLLQLENDAKMLLNAFEGVDANFKELITKVQKAGAEELSSDATEEDVSDRINAVSGMLSRVSGLEGQLNDISRKIADKTAAFEDAKTHVVRAQKSVTALLAEYNRQKKEIEPRVSELVSELAKMEKEIDPKLFEKYMRIRKSNKMPKVIDVVVPLSDNRCGGCYFELPLSLVHKISTNGYIICEECGKIIYK